MISYHKEHRASVTKVHVSVCERKIHLSVAAMFGGGGDGDGAASHALASSAVVVC